MKKLLFILLTALPFISQGQVQLQAKVNGVVGGLLTTGYGIFTTSTGIRIDTSGVFGLPTKAYVNSVAGGGATPNFQQVTDVNPTTTNSLTARKYISTLSNPQYSSEAAFSAKRFISGTTNTRSYLDTTSYTITGGVPGFAGFDARATMHGLQMDHIVSFQARPILDNDSVDYVEGADLITYVTRGKLKSNYGIHYEPPVLTGGATLQNNTAIFIEPGQPGVNKYALFSSDLTVNQALGGKLMLGDTSKNATIQATLLTAKRTQQLPDKSGTFAMLSDITGGGGGLSGLTANYLLKAGSPTTAVNSLAYDDGSNVGIGTTTPASKLHVSAGGSVGLTIESSAGFSAPLSRFRNSSSGGYAVMEVWGGSGIATGDEMQFGQYATGDLFYFTNGNYNHVFYTQGSPRFSVTGGGNVGVGTTTPQTLLDVAGSIRTNVLSEYADDAAAAAGGIIVGQFYRTGSFIKQRVN